MEKLRIIEETICCPDMQTAIDNGIIGDNSDATDESFSSTENPFRPYNIIQCKPNSIELTYTEIKACPFCGARLQIVSNTN